MDIVLIVGASLLLILGILGCIIPGIPGPPIAWLALPLMNLHSNQAVHPEGKTLLIYGIAVTVITLLDYMLPIWGTKKFGGTKAGKTGSIIGLFGGIFVPVFGPLTLIIGPFLGAVVGELIAGQDQKTALKSGLGSFLGFLGGTLLKFAITGMLLVKFIKLVF